VCSRKARRSPGLRCTNARHPRQRQPAYKREEAHTCVYRRGSTLVFIIAGYTIHFVYGILLLDAGRREAESIISPIPQVGNGTAEEGNPWSEGPLFLSLEGWGGIRELGETVLSVCPSPNLFWRKRKCARSEFLIRQAKGGTSPKEKPYAKTKRRNHDPVGTGGSERGAH